ncbi:hypothetical protein ACFVMC_23735 [Nocardia sp. NPDC127579]|uniref:hypothetical protein n=1 Tax=Nocardia sp. NPDC127579 TaxID=3345402 RepID=UPI003625AB99
MTHHLPPPPPPLPAPPAMPEDIRTARQLWWGVAGLAVVQLFASIPAMLGQRDELAKQLFEQMQSRDPAFTLEQADRLIPVAFVFAGLLALTIAGLVVLFAHFMARGKLWGRTLLTVAGVWLLLNTLGALVTIGSVSGVGSLLGGGASIVQGVLGGGAIYLMHRKESTAYFLAHRRR